MTTMTTNWYEDEPCPYCGGEVIGSSYGVQCLDCPDMALGWSQYRKLMAEFAGQRRDFIRDWVEYRTRGHVTEAA